MALFNFSKPKPSLDELIHQVVQHPQNRELKNALAAVAKRDPVKVLTNIIKYQQSIYSKEISVWKAARAEAQNIQNPRRVMITDIYEDIELDGYIYGIVHNKRILKISNKAFKICNTSGVEQAEKTKLFEHQWFNDFVKFAMQSRFFGYSLIYFYEWQEGEITTTELIPRRHVIPERQLWVKMQYDTLGFDYTQPPFNQYMLGVGRKDDLGLYEKAAILWILKRHSWQSWDEFEERFGIPIPIVETASRETSVLNAIEKYLRELSTASWGIIPEGGKLNIVETGKSDVWQLFYKKIEMAQRELEVLFTGQIRETNTNGTYGKEKVKEEEAQEVIIDDKTFIKNIVNDKLLPLLIANGYPFADDDYFDWNDGEKLNPTDRLAIFKGVAELGFKLDLNQVAEELDVKITGEIPPPPAPPKGNPKKPQTPYDEFVNMHIKINELYNNVH